MAAEHLVAALAACPTDDTFVEELRNSLQTRPSLLARLNLAAGNATLPLLPETAALSLLRTGAGDHAQTEERKIEHAHASAITCVRWAPGGDALLSGGADRAVVLTPLTGSSSTSVAFDAGVLCLDVHVALGLVAVGVMDGTVAVYDAALNEVRRFARHHRKYAHAVSFGGLPLLASASYDHSLSVFSVVKDGADVVAVGSVQCGGVVEAVAWLPKRRTLVAAVRGDHHLHMVDCSAEKLTAASLVRTLLNLNANGDSTVSYTVLALAPSVDGKWLALATDAGNALVLDAGTGEQVRTLCLGTLPDAMQPRPALAFHPSSKYLYASSQQPGQEGLLQVWELATQSPVAELRGHQASVRDVALHPHDPTRLVSAGFDKTLRVWWGGEA